MRLIRIRSGYYSTAERPAPGVYDVYSYRSGSLLWWNICQYDESLVLHSTGHFTATLRQARVTITNLTNHQHA